MQRRQSAPTEHQIGGNCAISSTRGGAGRAPPTSSRQQGAVVSTSWNSTATASQRRAPKDPGVEVVEIRTTMSAAGGPKIESPEQEEEGENKPGGSAEAVPTCDFVRKSDHSEVEVLKTAVASDIDAPFVGADPVDGNYTAPDTVAGDEDDHPVQLQYALQKYRTSINRITNFSKMNKKDEIFHAGQGTKLDL